MLRKGLVALMMGVICAGSAIADQPAPKRSTPAPTGLVGWFKNKTAGLRSSTPASKTTASKAAGSKASAAKQMPPKPGVKNATASNAAPSKRGGPARSLSVLPKAKAKTTAPGIEHAVVQDAERQNAYVQQTAARPMDSAPSDLTSSSQETAMAPAQSDLQPVPIQQAPILPNTSTDTGPQYFSASPAGMSNPIPVHPTNNWQTYQAPQPVQMVSRGQYWNASDFHATGPVYSGQAPMSVHNGTYPQNGTGMYPQTGAALYPAPRPGIPQQVGGIAIENQAFHPHEMLHAHRYRAVYPPYYYQVNGGWMVTPFGVWSREDWKLNGTTVDVNYKSHVSPFTLFHAPVIR